MKIRVAIIGDSYWLYISGEVDGIEQEISQRKYDLLVSMGAEVITITREIAL